MKRTTSNSSVPPNTCDSGSSSSGNPGHGLSNMRTTSTSSIRSTSSNGIPSYLRATAASQNKTSSTPRSKSREDLRRTPSVSTTGGSRKMANRQASTPVSKSKEKPSFDFSGTSSIGSISKPTTNNHPRPGAQKCGVPPEGQRIVRRNLMPAIGAEARNSIKAMPLRGPSKPAESTALEEDLALEVKKAAVLQAMFLKNQAKKALETAEAKAYCDRSYLWRCTKQIMEDIKMLNEEKMEMDSLTALIPHLKWENESFDHLNSSLEAILKVLLSIDDDMNRRCSLVVLNSSADVVNESMRKAIQEFLSDPAMGKRTTIKTQALESMCSEAVKMSELVSFIETLVKECQQLSEEAEKKMNYASNFRGEIQKHQLKQENGRGTDQL